MIYYIAAFLIIYIITFIYNIWAYDIKKFLSITKNKRMVERFFKKNGELSIYYLVDEAKLLSYATPIEGCIHKDMKLHSFGRKKKYESSMYYTIELHNDKKFESSCNIIIGVETNKNNTILTVDPSSIHITKHYITKDKQQLKKIIKHIFYKTYRRNITEQDTYQMNMHKKLYQKRLKETKNYINL